MEEILKLLDDYFVFFDEYNSAYVQYSFSTNEELAKKVRVYSRINRNKISEIHNAMDLLSNSELNNLKTEIENRIYALEDENNIININIKRQDLENVDPHKYNYFCDKICHINHRIYCYVQIVLNYMEKGEIKRLLLNK